MRACAVLCFAVGLIAAPCVTADNGEGTDAGLNTPLSGFVFVPGGTRLLGDARSTGAADERPAHLVTLDGYYLSETEVTFASFDLYCDDTHRARPSDNGWGRGDRPVVNVSWMDAAEYCNWLSARDGLRPFYGFSPGGVGMDWTANGYRLPTEAEWEYAASGGSSVESGALSPPVGWIQSTSGGRTHPVATSRAGPLGLYDMIGNVWEWCNDWYGVYPSTAQSNPRGPEGGQLRVLRGGSWYDTAVNLRITVRNRHPPVRRLPMMGFRLARSGSATVH